METVLHKKRHFVIHKMKTVCMTDSYTFSDWICAIEQCYTLLKMGVMS